MSGTTPCPYSMRAIILAAGVGSRLQALSGGKPKCLVEIGGRPLILHQLEALADHGIGPVLIVAGYKADEVRSVVGDRAEFVVNDSARPSDCLLRRQQLAEDHRLLGPRSPAQGVSACTETGISPPRIRVSNLVKRSRSHSGSWPLYQSPARNPVLP